MSWPNLKQYSYATAIGYCALLFWAFAPIYWVVLRSLPTAEVLSIIFSIAALPTLYKILRYHDYQILTPAPVFWLLGIFGIYGLALDVFTAMKLAPAAHVELICCLWPIVAIIFTSFLPNESLSLRHLLAVLLGALGIYFLITEPGSALSTQYTYGYFFAALNTIIWSIYTLAVRYIKYKPRELIGFYFTISAIAASLHHFIFEQSIMPTLLQWMILIIMGITTQRLAYQFWYHGNKYGNYKLLSILAYGNPILSIALLCLCGIAKPSMALAIACMFVTLACIIATFKWSPNLLQQRTIK